MRIVEVAIKNYRSFDPTGQTIRFSTTHTALVGKNNAGKSNILTALDILFGSKNPQYANVTEEDFFDPTKPIEITAQLGDFQTSDRSVLFGLPNITKQQQGALGQKLADGSARITLSLRKALQRDDLLAEEAEVAEGFDLTLWGFTVHRKKEDVRHALARMLIVPALRDVDKELAASNWTAYGQLMKGVLEASSEYSAIKTDLATLNARIQKVFDKQKKAILQGARVVSYVDDISFQLTKENNPSELLRNLEVYILDGGRSVNIDNVGTGTQSAIVLGILEIALKAKYGHLKVFGVEEPEAFIHPHGIRYLGALIRHIVDDSHTQVILATHSLSLTAHFEPREIILVAKEGGKTVVRQSAALTGVEFRRFVHQDNAEMFFSDRLVFIEGATEKHLLSKLDKLTPQDAADPTGENCNFDRRNVGVIRLDSVNSLPSYIRIADAFGLPWIAIADKDFLKSSRPTCTELGLTFQTTDPAKMAGDLRTRNVFVNTKGEIEDLFPDADIAAASGKTLADVTAVKTKFPTKTSDAFKELFGTGKAEYAITLADYYESSGKPHPLASLIRAIYENQPQAISF